MQNYKTWILDCDGVILDSNHIKTDAFKYALRKFNSTLVDKLILYHKTNGGISRDKKIEYFSKSILPQPLSESDISSILSDYAYFVKNELINSRLTDGLLNFLTSVPGRKIVCSGGREVEIKDVFVAKNIMSYFSGVFGSPKSKEEILKSINIEFPAMYIGDSLYDYKVAMEYGIDFCFMRKYSESPSAEQNCVNKTISVDSFIDLLLHMENT